MSVSGGPACAQGQNTESGAHQTETQREFAPDTHGAITAYALFNQPGQDDPTQHHGKGVHRLEHGGRNGIAQNIAVHKAVDIQADRTAALLGKRPEQHTEQGQGDNQPQFFALFGRLRLTINFCQHDQADRGRHD
ncbi:Uncharacterised protein [Salmonella enterica subsp. enterica serovar Bovismorbificans]|uniref:Uncharacterized protein n=1 Tax=Salmonella enterica subsp. enterica serovar Bovismorbificans TaxID=58097 RepID=A0A655BSR5_SALET|nr:Uncharacterised protein [Salmonella enterica subsp. enterica serovar Bovismorbificans]CNU97047.1 Uncharacterised protein [Salmonella enterica subsp. enterica serovar Bovismorbificans]